MNVLHQYYDVERPYIYCKLTVGKKRGIHVTASGFAKCSVDDKWDEVAGKELAMTRALVKATRKYRKKLEEQMHKGTVKQTPKSNSEPTKQSDDFEHVVTEFFGVDANTNAKGPTPSGKTSAETARCDVVDMLTAMMDGMKNDN